MLALHRTSICLFFFLFVVTNCVDSNEDLQGQTEEDLHEKAGDVGSEDLAQHHKVSDCGGFQVHSEEELLVPRSDPAIPYCDAEVLKWHFNQASSRLELIHTRIPLNCCGDHSVTVEKQDNAYVVTEIDQPEDMRCRCVCVFDFRVDFSVQDAETLELIVQQYVTDEASAPRKIYSEYLDLSEGSGMIVLNDQPLGGVTGICSE